MAQGDFRPAARRLGALASKVLPAAWTAVWPEFRSALERQRTAAAITLANRQVVERRLASGEPLRLELGAGSNRLPGWTTIDSNGCCDLHLDLAQPLPLPDRTVHAIYASHVLEHFLYPEPMLGLLRECRRVLEPGGTISVAVPDASIYLRAYFQPGQLDETSHSLALTGLSYRSSIDYVNYMAYMAGTHHHMFDQAALLAVLEEAGFGAVAARGFDPALDHEGRRHETIYARGER